MKYIDDELLNKLEPTHPDLVAAYRQIKADSDEQYRKWHSVDRKTIHEYYNLKDKIEEVIKNESE